jgi:hypothetical protein
MGARMILCSISTKGRYHTTLPLAIMAVINQTKKVDKLVIFDDNDTPEDMRQVQIYQYMFEMMNLKGIAWEWAYALKKGQHYNHQKANEMGVEWCWRVDDDCVPEPNVLETLYSYVNSSVGAVGGAILTPPYAPVGNATGMMEHIDKEQSIQWNPIKVAKEVDHLHCSFLYRAGIQDYNLALSKVAFREETLFTYGLKKKGYGILVVPNATTWHVKNKFGGVRTEQESMFAHDDMIFRNIMSFDKQTIVVLDNGMGDHIIAKKILPLLKDPVVFSCYPDIVPGRSIQEAKDLFGDIDQWNIYKKMDQWNWKGEVLDAFKKMYGVI